MTRDELLDLIPRDFETCACKSTWDKLYGRRSYLHDRWEDYAGWTLPYIYPNDTYMSSTEMQMDFQSIGARAINHLANKIVSTLFVPNRPFFRIDLPKDQVAIAVEQGIEEAQLEQITAATETQALKQLERVGLRIALLQAIKSLIAVGNSLVYMPETDKKAQVYNLKDYVIKRDMSGNMVLLITRDTTYIDALPEHIADMAKAKGVSDPDTELTIYTQVIRVGEDKFLVKQEIEDLFVIPNAKGVYSEDTLPWIPLTWNLPRGYDYGTGLVEEYAGSFASLSAYTESMRNLAAIAADIKILVDPMSQTDLDGLNRSEPGTAVFGNRDDLEYLSLEKTADLQFMAQAIQDLKEDIGAAFLLATAVTRDAERVTAYEIQQQAHELEESLGGVYSRLAQELQQPIAKRLLQQMDNSLRDLEINVLTGVEALSRTSDLDQLMMMFQDATMLSNLPEGIQHELDMRRTLMVLGAHRHVNYEPLLKTEEQKQQEREQAMQEQERMMAAEAAAKQQPQQ